ncbi:MAG: Gfo/Idh/MocA family oxidoreductase [Vicingaceae bacterium]|nr:Gfo/Idh/MocA family oxidoreductase [Vicingaceae bacterium]
MLRIGLIGSGYLIEKHIKSLQSLSDYTFICFFDTHQNKSTTIPKNHLSLKVNSLEELLHKVDVVFILNLPEQSRIELIVKSLKSSKHVLIDKSNIKTTVEARKLLELAEEAGVKVQISNISYFTPLFKSAKNYISCPTYIEAITHIHYKNKSSDAIFDLLCDDICLIINTVKSNLKRISTVGIDVINSSPELIHVKLEFDNGCIANITINTIAEDDKKTVRFFENNSTILLDFLDNNISLLTHNEASNVTQKQNIILLKTSEIEQEFSELHLGIMQQKQLAIDLHTMYKILDITFKISEKLKINFSLT